MLYYTDCQDAYGNVLQNGNVIVHCTIGGQSESFIYIIQNKPNHTV